MFKKSLLLSEVFNPYMDDNERLLEIIKKTHEQNRYSSIETDVIFDKYLRNEFKNISKESNWSVTNWVVNELTQSGLSASALEKNKYDKTIDRIYKLIDLSYEGNGEYFGIASGPIEDETQIDKALDRFENTLHLVYERIKSTDMKIVIEPLDQFAHKKFLIGTTDRFEKFLQRFDDTDLIKNDRLSLCYDCAHFALNEDVFSESIPRLAKYTSKIHLSNAVLDKNSTQYGDHHMPLGEPGFMNVKTAKNVIEEFELMGKDNLDVAGEARTHNKNEVWKNEEKIYDFVDTVL